MNTSCNLGGFESNTYIPEYIYLSHADLKQVPHEPALFLFGRDFNVDPSVAADLDEGAAGKYAELSGYLRKYFDPITPQNGGVASEYVIRTRNLLAYLQATLTRLSDAAAIDASKYYRTMSLAEFFTKWANAERSEKDFSTFYKSTTGFDTWYDALIYIVVQVGDLQTLKENAPPSAADRRDILEKVGLQAEESRAEEASESICCTLRSEDDNSMARSETELSGQGFRSRAGHLFSINDYVAKITKYLGHNW
jgi:hypothetical protein